MTDVATILSYLEMGAFAAQIFSLPVAAFTLVLNRIEGRAMRDLQIALTLSESFRKYWESGWEVSLARICDTKKSGNDRKGKNWLSDEDANELRHMLNWIDWLGTFVRTRAFSNPHLIIGSIEFRLRQIIDCGEEIIVEESWLNGLEYWRGVITVAELLRIESITRLRKLY